MARFTICRRGEQHPAELVFAYTAWSVMVCFQIAKCQIWNIGASCAQLGGQSDRAHRSPSAKNNTLEGEREKLRCRESKSA